MINVTYFRIYVTFPIIYVLTFTGNIFIYKLQLNIMNSIETLGNWAEQKGKLKQKFATLMDNDLLFAEGQKEEMLEKLQIKLGKTKEELNKIISTL